MTDTDNSSNQDSSSSGGSDRSHGSDRGDRSQGGDRRRQRPRYRRKVLDTRNLVLDYKHPEILERFISKTGKVLPRRMTGATAKIQRKIAREIKRARQISLLPITRR
ncbi:MAG: 30S ribosomal protein S18 [Spirochaetales bacterium]|nr:30S ribosomal protein S18 [Leptospiraceae bacterium]MCP5480676.1 30S ribosomal protein S18 [Spirochaetales bacterium]MCP5484028.1 30S ribosomal protein S18 [Spirochaetales bacterium]